MALDLRTFILDVPDFPKKGILFRDITPLLASAEALREAVRLLALPWVRQNIAAVAAAEARGFMLGPAVALELDAGFIPLRKPGKLPRKTRSASFALEYGEASLHVHETPFPKGKKILLLDDVLATGGTAEAMVKIVKELDGVVAGFSFLIELGFLKGRERLPGIQVESLLHY